MNTIEYIINIIINTKFLINSLNSILYEIKFIIFITTAWEIYTDNDNFSANLKILRSKNNLKIPLSHKLHIKIKTNAITASGARATAWYTVAAGRGLPMGTVIYIPALSYAPNGGWFIVQDRGGAISNSKLDIYMNTHSAALSYGRKTLECYVYY